MTAPGHDLSLWQNQPLVETALLTIGEIKGEDAEGLGIWCSNKRWCRKHQQHKGVSSVPHFHPFSNFVVFTYVMI